jgi:hypothetical protein
MSHRLCVCRHVNRQVVRSNSNGVVIMANGSEIFRGVLKDARKQLLLDYDASNGFAHSSIKGEERAEDLASFLQTRLPPAFGITTGEAIDRYDNRTGQLDLIIYDRTVTKPVYAGRKNELHPCEAIYAVIEVKSLLNLDQTRICVGAAEKLRQLRPFGKRFVDARTMGAHADNREEHRCMYIVFAFATDLSKSDWPQKEYNRFANAVSEKKASISNIDRLIVLDRGLINFADGQGRAIDADPVSLFMEFFLHLINFLERERRRRPPLWQDYAPSHSEGRLSLKKT